MNQWKVEALLLDESGEVLDYIEINAGPTMRGWLYSNRAAITGGRTAQLRVAHLPTCRAKTLDITMEGAFVFRAGPDLVTLERGVKLLKAELEAQDG